MFESFKMFFENTPSDFKMFVKRAAIGHLSQRPMNDGFKVKVKVIESDFYGSLEYKNSSIYGKTDVAFMHLRNALSIDLKTSMSIATEARQILYEVTDRDSEINGIVKSIVKEELHEQLKSVVGYSVPTNISSTAIDIGYFLYGVKINQTYKYDAEPNIDRWVRKVQCAMDDDKLLEEIAYLRNLRSTSAESMKLAEARNH